MLAELLDEIAALRATHDDNPYAVQAYRRAADAIRTWPHSVASTATYGGSAALRTIPGIGPAVAATLEEYVRTGRSAQREDLRGEADRERLFMTLPGIGPGLAQRIVHDLGITTLEQLATAADSGRLHTAAGFGPRRISDLREVLRRRLAKPPSARVREAASSTSPRERSPADTLAHQSSRPRHSVDAPAPPSVALVLALDVEFRAREHTGRLRHVAPHRHNPEHKPWLPIWETRRDGHAFTLMFSNSDLAHRLGRTHDWVIVVYDPLGPGSHRRGEMTVVTETRGPLAGLRVVRGHEEECARFYESSAA